MARYHRKGEPTIGQFSALARKGDDALLSRCSAVLRLAEQLERSRDQAVDRVDVRVEDGRVELLLEAHEDVSIARWAAQKEQEVFRRAFGRDLEVSEARASRKAKRSPARAR
jgi:exopolyphosphatase/guanosine-5'-triphosphate,3'-diphosphate pyrophosphatase